MKMKKYNVVGGWVKIQNDGNCARYVTFREAVDLMNEMHEKLTKDLQLRSELERKEEAFFDPNNYLRLELKRKNKELIEKNVRISGLRKMKPTEENNHQCRELERKEEEIKKLKKEIEYCKNVCAYTVKANCCLRSDLEQKNEELAGLRGKIFGYDIQILRAQRALDPSK